MTRRVVVELTVPQALALLSAADYYDVVLEDNRHPESSRERAVLDRAADRIAAHIPRPSA